MEAPRQHRGDFAGVFVDYFRAVGTGSYLLAALCVLGLAPRLRGVLMMLPHKVVFRGQVWRAVTFPFATEGFVGLLFQWLFLFTWASTTEKRIGTVNLLLRIPGLSLLLTLFYLAFFGTAWTLWPQAAPLFTTAGFFPLFFAEICAEALRDPWQPTLFFFLPCPVPRISLPLLFLGFDWLVGQSPLRHLPCLPLGALLWARPGLPGTAPPERLRGVERLLLRIDGLGTFYSVNAKDSLAREASGSLFATQTRLGGATLTAEQNRARWNLRFVDATDPRGADEATAHLNGPEAPK